MSGKHDLGRVSVDAVQDFNESVLNSSNVSENLSFQDNKGIDSSGMTTVHDTKEPLNSNTTRSVPIDSTCYLKLLVSNLVAGSVIGPKGSTVSHISNATNSIIKLSNLSSHYPGTNERVMVISGKLHDLQAAFVMIIDRIRDSHETTMMNGPNAASPRLVVKIVVPNSAVSQIIGRQGKAVKELQEKTNTKIQISNRDECQLKERVITITGQVENVTEASMHIIESIQSNPHIRDHTKLDYSSPNRLQSIRNNGLNYYFPGVPLFASANIHPVAARNSVVLSPQLGAALPGTMSGRSLGATPDPIAAASLISQNMASNKSFVPLYNATPASLSSTFDFADPLAWNTAGACPILDYTFEVPDGCVGCLIGRNGVTLQNIQEQAGVRIRISGKGEFIPGTENRKLTISGNPVRIQCAAILLQHRLHAMESAPRARCPTQGGQYMMDSSMSTSLQPGSSSLTPIQTNGSGSVLRGGSLILHQNPTTRSAGYRNESRDR